MKRFRTLLVTGSLLLLIAGSAAGQCAMCRANAESNYRSGKNDIGKGLNNGILYLMSVPYVLAGVGAFILIKNKRKH
jgi:hypothetical protein